VRREAPLGYVELHIMREKNEVAERGNPRHLLERRVTVCPIWNKKKLHAIR